MTRARILTTNRSAAPTRNRSPNSLTRRPALDHAFELIVAEYQVNVTAEFAKKLLTPEKARRRPDMNAAILKELTNRHSGDAVTAIVAWHRLVRAGFAECRPPDNPGELKIIGRGLVFALNGAGKILEREGLRK